MNEQVKALLNERDGYVRRGLKDRVKAVDAALESLGYKSDKPSSDPIETAAVDAHEETASIRKAAPRRKA